jgi:16S rRNA (cytidine1402-2'-O)-methyltransferase
VKTDGDVRGVKGPAPSGAGPASLPAGGRLVVCATPIGNLGDVTLRVLDALRDADVIAAEDTRVTRKLLSRYDIHTLLEPYHAKNLAARTPALVDRIAAGAVVALVSDAGTPGISDPGAHLVDATIDAGLPVDVLPGACAIVTALVASGLPTHAFYFGGFLPRKAGDRRRALEKVAGLDATLLFYESPHRAAATLASVAEVMPGRRAAMARELTKFFAEVVRAPVEGLADQLAARELKGEIVLVVGPPESGELRGGASVAGESDEAAIFAAYEAALADGLTRRDAVKEAARRSGAPRNAVYGLVTRRGRD